MNTVTDEAIVKKIIQSEAGQKAAAAIERDHTAERMNLRATAEKLKRERGELSREHADAVAATGKALEAARAALTKAEQAHRQASVTQATERAHYDARIQKLERMVIATAPAAIDTFLRWLSDEESICKGTEITERGRKTDRISTHTGELIREYFSNAATLRDRLAAIRKARAEAAQLKTRIMDSGELDKQLEALGDLPGVVMQFAYEK